VVLDGDALVEDVAVAEVAVEVLLVVVEPLQLGVEAEVEGEAVAPLVVERAARRPFAEAASAGVLGAVEAQATAGVHPSRGVGQPPVDQVEVMARLVDQEPAGLLLLAVPTPEVVGTVG